VVLSVVAVFAVASYTNWCGHGQEFIPVPEAGGYWLLVPVLEP